MRFCSRSRRSRTCRTAAGIFCVLLLVYSAGVYVGRHPTIGNDRREARRDGKEELKLTAISEYTEGQQWTSIPALPAGYNHSISKYIWTTAASIASVEHQTRAGRSLDTARVKISPKHPVVLEGHPIRLVCVVMQTLRNNASAAPFMTFELPSMNSKDKRTVKLFLRPGTAMVTIRSVRKGHEGRYTCSMVEQDGAEFYNTVILHVKENENRSNRESVEQSEEDEELVEVDGLEVLAAAPEDVEKVDKSQILHLRQQLDADLHIATNIDELLEKGKLQEKQVEKFCTKYNISHHQQIKLPGDDEGQKSLYRHLLVYDKAKTLFCFVPKTGCTNLRILFFLVQGYIPLSQFLQSRDAVDQNRLESAQFQESFFSRNDRQRLYALKNYFKFIMYRNPLNRLVSGYRSKVARFPLIGLSKDTPHYNWLRHNVLLRSQPRLYQEFLHYHRNMSINITFSDFINYWVEQPLEIKYDEHFRSIFSISQPCRVRYNFYGDFKDFERDSMVLIEQIQAKPQYLREGYYKNKGVSSTEELASGLYKELSEEQKMKVLKVLKFDLDFYYHVFPDQNNVHKFILGLDVDLPT